VALLLVMTLVAHAAVIVLLTTIHSATVRVALALRAKTSRSAALARPRRVRPSWDSWLEHGRIFDERLRYTVAWVAIRRAIELILRIVRVVRCRLVALLLLLSALRLRSA
jgi:hypothetical protein